MKKFFVLSLLLIMSMMAYAQTEVKWTSVELEKAGTLGNEVLYKVDVLSDVEYLKVKGAMNDDDWTTITNMANLKGADFSEAIFESVPHSQFYRKTNFHLVKLPQGLKSIGYDAFSDTAIETIDIPYSVTSIGSSAFYNCKALKSVSLPNGITKLADATFCYCETLSSVILPSTLQSIGSDCFRYTALKNIDFPQVLSSIGSSAFSQTPLEEVVLPENLSYIGYNAFGYCRRLKNLVLPISPSSNTNRSYYCTFQGCYALEKVVCPAATPPTVYDMFSGVDRSKVTLVVPAFAIVDYKLDTYWHDFGSIVEGAEPSTLMIGSTLTLTNNRRPTNKADVTIGEGGQLTVGGNAPLEIGTLTFTENRYSDRGYGQLLNNTTAMTADQVVSRFYVYSGQWYFITPLHDVNISDINHSEADASFIFRYYNGQNRAANGPIGSWQDILGTTLKAGQGYILQSNRRGWITMPATANGKTSALISTDATTALTAYAAADATDANWNYAGNPYPCYYDSYYMDLAAPITVWDYDNRTYRAYSPIDDDYVLSPMEAFFVQKPNTLDQILFRKEGRQTSATSERTASARRKAQSERQLFDIEITDGSQKDVTRLAVNPYASGTYEPACDVVKFFSEDTTIAQIYTLDDQGNQLAINERPLGKDVVRMGIRINQPGTYTLSMKRGNGTLMLTDTETGRTVDLSHESYAFSTNQTGDFSQRFTLALGNSTTSVKSVVTPQQQKTDHLYNLQGHSVESPAQPGIYVRNGKKIVVK